METSKVSAAPGADFQADEIIIGVGQTLEKKVDAESFYYVLSGYGLLSVETYGYSLNPETALYVPGAKRHTFTNSGAVDLALVRYTV